MSTDAVLRAALAVALLSLPWVFSAIAAVIQTRVHQRLTGRGQELAIPARRWVEALARRSALPTRIEVHPSLSEAYFPHADIVGLSPEAAHGVRPAHRAVVAHELGHAATLAAWPVFRTLAPLFRLLADALPHAATAAAVVAAIHGSPWMAWLTAVLVGATAVVWLGVAADEAAATRRAWRWLGADPHLGGEGRHLAFQALTAAFLAYAAPTGAWAGLALASPWWLAHLVGSSEVLVAQPLFAGGVFVVGVLPFLALHTGLVCTEAIRPEPVASAFHLEQRAERDSSWAFTAGACVAVIAGSAMTNGTSVTFELCLAAALFVASGPASMAGRAALLLPIWLCTRALGRWTDEPSWGTARGGAEDAPRALAGLWERPPWSLRAARLTGLAWVPLLAAISWIAWEQST
jgi:Zn-dependent membrane protease YugP